jgi:RNA-splicing ligase RtcB
MEKLHERLWSWAVDLDAQTRLQAEKTARLPIIADHVALMPDAHLGKGATVGSVVACEGAVIPAAVGVDLGCGMIAARTDLVASALPDDLGPVLSRMERDIPSGVGTGHAAVSRAAERWMRANPPASELSARQLAKACTQFGSLGSGNHFAEVCLDGDERVWVLLHSGSRGIGNELAQAHIATARTLAKEGALTLEDRDLAWFTQETPEFAAYVADMTWSQHWALANRAAMMDAALRIVFDVVGHGAEVERVNAHHNFCARERHGGRDLWVTRKGAIRAGAGELGIIPGSMGTRSFIVRGLGNPASFESCSHGAGRRMSRSEAKRRFTTEDLVAQMGDRTWLAGRAQDLIDEIPSSYKDIDEVMAAQTDLVEVVAELGQVLNYKGT